MSFITEYIVNQGVPKETVTLILILPIVATVIVLFRQVIGLRGFSIYTPLILSFVFLTTGLKYGLVIFILSLSVGIIVKALLKQVRLLYLPRMAIVLISVAMTILILGLIGALLGRTYFISAPSLAILIIIILIEKFIAAQIKRGAKETLILTAETLFLSVVCYWIITWTRLSNLVFLYPLWTIGLSIALNIFLGRWTGLRLSEYIRFRKIIKRVELPKKNNI